MLRAVLFDAVGTLLHLREPVGETYARSARSHGVTVAADALQAAFPRALRAMPPMVFPGLAPDRRHTAERDWWRAVVRATFRAAGVAERPTEIDGCFEELFTYYAGAAGWRAADGATDVLRALRARGLRTGVVSNFDHRLPALLAALGLAPLLDVVVLPADAGAAKPDPGIFAVALERLQVGAAEAAYVGDDADDDIAGAERAGLRAIDVARVGDLRALGALLCPQ
jgi:putative hydrolase of the HAD superfamily